MEDCHRFKAVGVSLAIASGVFIGVSFVLKKKGLLAANIKDGKEAGEGYGYLKNGWWWSGMILSSFLPGIFYKMDGLLIPRMVLNSDSWGGL